MTQLCLPEAVEELPAHDPAEAAFIASRVREARYFALSGLAALAARELPLGQRTAQQDYAAHAHPPEREAQHEHVSWVEAAAQLVADGPYQEIPF